jgi:transposase-like protein
MCQAIKLGEKTMALPFENSAASRHDATTDVIELICKEGFDGLAKVLEILFNNALLIEREKHIGASPYERSEGRKTYANGFKPKTMQTRLGELTLAVPQTRDGEFYPNCLEKGIRSERALKLALAEMYVQGVSTRKVTKIMEDLCGSEISSAQVARATKLLDEELTKWRGRPLGAYQYLLLDAQYQKVRQGGVVRDSAVLIAIGIDHSGNRQVLGTSVSLSEAEVHWREFLRSLQARGLHGVECITSDAHEGLKAAIRATVPGVKWQRCQFHLQQNAQAYIPKVEMKKEVAADIRKIFNASDREDANRLIGIAVEKYAKKASKLSEWIEHNIHEGLTVFDLPESHRKRLRTSNLIERLNREIKRRTKVVGIFPNEASCLRLISALLKETSEEWESGKRYLPMAS